MGEEEGEEEEGVTSLSTAKVNSSKQELFWVVSLSLLNKSTSQYRQKI